MKMILNLCCAASLACLASLAAHSSLGIAVPAAVALMPTEGSLARHVPPVGKVVFNSHARSKIVQYFDTYRNDPLGLPPVCATSIKAHEIPVAWGNSGIAAGAVIKEIERPFLVDAPMELVRVLPGHSAEDVRYYLAGSNLVAVSPGYKVLDSVRIPTVRLPQPGERAEPLQLVRYVGVRSDQ